MAKPGKRVFETCFAHFNKFILLSGEILVNCPNKKFQQRVTLNFLARLVSIDSSFFLLHLFRHLLQVEHVLTRDDELLAALRRLDDSRLRLVVGVVGAGQRLDDLGAGVGVVAVFSLTAGHRHCDRLRLIGRLKEKTKCQVVG